MSANPALNATAHKLRLWVPYAASPLGGALALRSSALRADERGAS